ncbi:hypothetical protein BsWGS_25453 [Bradybaena similaris]
MALDARGLAQSGLDNYFIRTSLWPAIAYTALLMVVGTVGNILVLYVYRRHFQRSVTRMFIYVLAILDLGNCLITMPAELSILIHFTTFSNPSWCKVSRYLTYTFNGTSCMVLITIAMDRYFKVCRPMNTIITIHRGRIICIVAFCVTAVLSIPSLVIYGEMKLPILVTETGATILPASIDLVNSTVFPKAMARAGRHFTESPSQDTSTGGDSSPRTSYAPNEGSSYLVYGRFCLLSSEHIHGHLPLLFYISIFVLYIVMVVLVVFFYGKVAKTMFTLTSKHAKMFSFYTHKNCTPSSNSVNPEDSIGPFQAAGSKVIANEVSSADHHTKHSSTVVGGPKCGDNEANSMKTSDNRQTKNFYNSHKEKHSEHRGLSVLFLGKNRRETGYETGDTSSNSEVKAETVKVNSEDKHNKESTTKDGGQEGLLITNNPADKLDNSNLQVHKLSEYQKGSILPLMRSRKAQSSYGGQKQQEKENRRRTTVGKKHKESNKIPKIKVEEADTGDYDSDNAISKKQYTRLTGFSQTTNSLLRRRIQSAENIHHLSGLQMLQVPDGRTRQPYFPDLIDTGDCGSLFKQQSRRDNIGSIGYVTKSCVNLDYTADNPNSTTASEKTVTLTKTSSLGKTMCVLPLRGMSTKTASQGHKRQTVPAADNIPTSEAIQLNQEKNGNVSKSDSRLELGQRRCDSGNLAVRPTTLILNPPDGLDSVVTLRHATPKSSSLPNDILKQFNFDAAVRAPRKKVPSTADILQERHRKCSLHPFRMSRMLFVISLVFVVSFLPFFIIALMRSFMGLSFLALDPVELAVMSVFIRSSLLSNAVNPVAYGFLSTHFRRECTGIMCCMFRR